MTPPRAPTGRLIGTALVGVVVGAVGTGIHRAAPPWGVVLALLIVLSASALARAWARGPGLVALGAAFGLTIVAMGLPGPGGDVLIAAQPVGIAWYASIVAVAAAGLLPRRWFSDEPIRRSGEPIRRIDESIRPIDESIRPIGEGGAGAP